MRRLGVFVLTILAIASTAAPALAQSTDGKTWGFQAGFGVGYGAVPEGTTRDPEPTFNLGVFAELPLSERWSFQPELKFDKRTITTNEIPTAVSYISVPLLLKNEFFGIYMVQGASLNFVASASVFDVDFKDAITSPDVAIVVGVGKRFDRWSVEGRWETGLRSFQKDLEISGVRLRALTGLVSFYMK